MSHLPPPPVVCSWNKLESATTERLLSEGSDESLALQLCFYKVPPPVSVVITADRRLRSAHATGRSFTARATTPP